MGREDRKKGTSDQRKLSCVDCKGEDGAILPGFRFHPTDEELVGFYLRRKVENKPAVTDIIKQMDIYKHDPWDLPKTSNHVGEKEWYFFCRRGRKYRNSIRPNRVTGSGFWKATGIDRPIYYMSQDTNHCIGLKKSLVYYTGSAGKGMKTDWMMHEFRFPNSTKTSNKPHITISKQEAEIWTLCRIFKKSGSSKRSVAPNLGKLLQTQSTPMCITTRSELVKDINDYFGAYPIQQNEMKQYDNNHSENTFNSVVEHYEATPSTTSHPGILCSNLGSSFSRFGNFDELRAVVDSASGSSPYSLTDHSFMR